MKKQKFATKKELRRYKAILNTMDPNTQTYWVLNRLLLFRSVSAMQAFRDARITRLSARIYELRHDYGIPIEKEYIYNNGPTYSVYYIGRP